MTQDDPNKTSILKASVTFNSKTRLILAKFITKDSAYKYEIPPVEIRRRLRKVEKMLGESTVNENVFPLQIETMGNYAVSINWSDGHSATIYTFEDLMEVCQMIEQEKKRKSSL